ncbi:MAG: FtsQ-type POTRA domain-containing protein [Gammaproteobacteria bacterium]|nr:FtsQ-type POTRA domain-containing protein [Gammaproteobacteria bacterium]
MTEPRRELTGNEADGARLAVLVVTIVLMASLALVALDRLLLPGRFAIDEVVVAGDAPNVDPAAVLAAVRELGPRSWFSVDLDEVERVVRGVPWVYDASVRRRWPGKLVVTVSQATPFARFNDSGWVNRAGESLTLPRGFHGARLPRLYGPADRAAEIAENYVELAALFDVVDAVALVGLALDARGSWEMELASRVAPEAPPVAVIIGRESLVERVSRLAASLRTPLSAERAAELASAAAIDLRYPNGFAVRFAADADGTGRVVESRRSSAGDGTG